MKHAAAVLWLAAAATVAAGGARIAGQTPSTPPAVTTPASTATLTSDLDTIFKAPILDAALTAVRIESVRSGAVIYSRNPGALVMPASNMKLITMAVAADHFGWDFHYTTTLEATGPVVDGTLRGDLIVTGTGDPSIGSPDAGHAPLFLEWADILRRAGISRVDGRLIGNDRAFDGETLGAGWAWDYLSAGYAAPFGALAYNEDVVVVRVTPGTVAGGPARVELTPPGHQLALRNAVTTGVTGSAATLTIARAASRDRLDVQGSVPAGGTTQIRTASVNDPTAFFLEALRLALADRGITITNGTADMDAIASPVATSARRVIASHDSAPMSSLMGYAMKVSQNFYGEMIFKALGAAPGRPASAPAARDLVRDTLQGWGIPPQSLVMYDGSGLSRYNYVTAGTIVAVLQHVWRDERLRGPFVAALPVGGHDGTLETRMRNTTLDRHIQAKTGTINNARALSGYADTTSGDKLAFSIIVNHYTAPNAEIDVIVEKALARVIED